MAYLIYRGKGYIFLRVPDHGNKYEIPLHMKIRKIEKKIVDGKITPIFPLAAHQFQRKVELEVLNGTFRIENYKIQKKTSEEPQPQMMTFSAVLNEMLRIKNKLSPAMVAQYKNSSKKFIDALGDLPLAEYATPKVKLKIADFRTQLLQDLAQPTAAKIIRNNGTVFRYAVDEGYCALNPMRRFWMAEEKKDPIIFTREELAAFIKDTMVHDRDLLNQCMYLMLTGLRATESCLARWDNVNLEKNIVKHHNIKGKRDELMPLDNLLHDFLTHLPHTYEPRIFKYADRYALRWRFLLAAKRLNFRKGLTVHTFKKMFGQSLYDTDIDVNIVADLMHHANISTWRDHYMLKDVKKNRQALAKSRKPLKGLLPVEMFTDAVEIKGEEISCN